MGIRANAISRSVSTVTKHWIQAVVFGSLALLLGIVIVNRVVARKRARELPRQSMAPQNPSVEEDRVSGRKPGIGHRSLPVSEAKPRQDPVQSPQAIPAVERFKYSTRNTRHRKFPASTLSADEILVAVRRLYGIADKTELLAALVRLYRSEHINRSVTDQLLSLLDAQTDEDVRNAVLEVLLYGNDESYTAVQVAQRYSDRPIADTTYRIVAAFPAKKEMLEFLISRFGSTPIDSRAAAETLNAIFLDGGFRGTQVATPLARVLEGQIPHVKREEIRAVLVCVLLATSDKDMPRFIESWWSEETSSAVRQRALQGVQLVGPPTTTWARSFLREVIARGPPAEELRIARDSLDRLTPKSGTDN